ncbi:hypothetical protein D3C84_969500 [compost metagenome]
MHANLVHHDQLRLTVAEQLDQFCHRRHVTITHRGGVELNELVNVAFFRSIHQVLQVAAGALSIDVHRTQAGLLGVLPDRRQG